MSINLTAVRCGPCGSIVGKYQIPYEKLLDGGIEPNDLLFYIGEKDNLKDLIYRLEKFQIKHELLTEYDDDVDSLRKKLNNDILTPSDVLVAINSNITKNIQTKIDNINENLTYERFLKKLPKYFKIPPKVQKKINEVELFEIQLQKYIKNIDRKDYDEGFITLSELAEKAKVKSDIVDKIKENEVTEEEFTKIIEEIPGISFQKNLSNNEKKDILNIIFKFIEENSKINNFIEKLLQGIQKEEAYYEYILKFFNREDKLKEFKDMVNKKLKESNDDLPKIYENVAKIIFPTHDEIIKLIANFNQKIRHRQAELQMLGSLLSYRKISELEEQIKKGKNIVDVVFRFFNYDNKIPTFHKKFNEYNKEKEKKIQKLKEKLRNSSEDQQKIKDEISKLEEKDYDIVKNIIDQIFPGMSQIGALSRELMIRKDSDDQFKGLASSFVSQQNLFDDFKSELEPYAENLIKEVDGVKLTISTPEIKKFTSNNEKIRYFFEGLGSGLTPGNALNALRIERLCCRQELINPAQISSTTFIPEKVGMKEIIPGIIIDSRLSSDFTKEQFVINEEIDLFSGEIDLDEEYLVDKDLGGGNFEKMNTMGEIFDTFQTARTKTLKPSQPTYRVVRRFNAI